MRHGSLNTNRNPAQQGQPAAPAFSLAVDVAMLQPLITDIVRQVLEHIDDIRATVPDRVAFTEAEAAALLGLESHQLRDERIRGAVPAFMVTGGRVRYRREDLVAYLVARPWTKETARRGHPNKKKVVSASRNGHQADAGRNRAAARNGHASARDFGWRRKVASKG
jgi:hypothetical protein